MGTNATYESMTEIIMFPLFPAGPTQSLCASAEDRRTRTSACPALTPLSLSTMAFVVVLSAAPFPFHSVCRPTSEAATSRLLHFLLTSGVTKVGAPYNIR